LCILAVSANPNVQFENVISGEEALDEQTLAFMYTAFLDHFQGESIKLYNSATTEHRFTIFKQNVLSIIEFNANPSSTYKKGLSFLADVTEQEFMDFYAPPRAP